MDDLLKDRVFFRHLNAHNKPVTRRDFLSLGLIGFGGMSYLSSSYANALVENIHGHKSIYNLVYKKKDPAFLVFDLAGGAALVGNFLVGNQGGAEDLLNSYERLGWNPRTQSLDNRFGLPMPEVSVSKILEGIIKTASTEAQHHFRFGSLLHIAKSDSSQNPLNGVSLVMNAGNRGLLMSSPLGTEENPAGGNCQFALKGEEYKPLQITSSMTLAQTLCLPNVVQFDSRFDPIARDIYGISAESDSDSRDVVYSSIVMNTIRGITGPGVITIGGCDYHDGTAKRGDIKDLEIGQNIGRALEFAYREKRALFIQVITDGGIYSQKGTRKWIGDSDDRCLTIMGYYNPDSEPQYKHKNKFQVGHYTQGQRVERNTIIGNSPLLSTYAVFANYMQISGRITEFEKFAPRIFSSSQLDEVLIFES